MLMSDANTNTLYSWAFDYPEPESIPASLEVNREKLIDIIDMIESCIGKEFEKDVDAFKVLHGREPTDSERQSIHPPIENYDPLRKQILLECFIRCLQIEIDEKYKLNFSLRLWTGCLETAKILALKSQSRPITREMRNSIFTERIDILASKDPIYRKGVEVACVWRPDPVISFDGVPETSSARKYEEDWIRREGIRKEKICEQ